MKGFINRGADLNRKSSDGFMPLCLAAFWGHSDIVKLLLEKGYSVLICRDLLYIYCIGTCQFLIGQVTLIAKTHTEGF